MSSLHRLLCLLLALVAVACTHARPTTVFMRGRPPEYRVSGTVREASLDGFIARVKKAQAAAAARPQQVLLPTVESTCPALARRLRALALDPNAETHRAVAAEYLRLGILDMADKHLTAALARNPRDAGIYDNRARLWRRAGLPAHALADAHRAVYFAPVSAPARNTLGTVLHALGDLAAARKQYDRAIALDPRAAYALNNRCSLDLLEGVPAQAIADCSRALDIDPTLPSAQQNLARATALLFEADGGAR